MLRHISAAFADGTAPPATKQLRCGGRSCFSWFCQQRGVSVKPRCDPCCGELEHENGHLQIRGESDLTEVTVSFS